MGDEARYLLAQSCLDIQTILVIADCGNRQHLSPSCRRSLKMHAHDCIYRLDISAGLHENLAGVVFHEPVMVLHMTHVVDLATQAH